MSTKYSIVSALVFSLVLSGFVGSASAATKDNKKKEEKKPAVTMMSSAAVQKTVEQKKDDKKKSPEGSLDQVVSLSSSALNTLAYQATQWKPNSYMGNGQHCSHHSRSRRA